MTSQKLSLKSSFWHSFWVAIRQNLWIFIVNMVLWLFTIDFCVLDFIRNIRLSQQTSSYRIIFCPNEWLIGLVTVTAFLTGILVFRFLFSKRASNVYLSMGIGRTKLFLSRFFAGFVITILPIILSMMIDLIINAQANGLSMYLVQNILYVTFVLSVSCLAVFALTVLICTLVGTAVEAIVVSTVILLAPTMLLSGLNLLMNRFLLGNAIGETIGYQSEMLPGLLDKYSLFNPVLSFWNDYSMKAMQGLYPDSPVTLESISRLFNTFAYYAWAIVAVLIAFAALRSFQLRKGESCGITNTNKTLVHIATFTVGFYLFGLICNIDQLFNGGRSVVDHTLSYIIGGIFAYIVLYFGLKLLLIRDFRAIFKGWFHLPIQLAGLVLVVLVLITGGFGYSSRIPAPKDVQNVTITYIGNDLIYNINGDNRNIENNNMLMVSSQSDIGIVMGIQKDFISNHKSEIADSLFKKTDKDIKTSCYIQIDYRLKNGKHIKRYYDYLNYRTLLNILQLDRTQTVQDIMANNLKSWVRYDNDISLSNSIYSNLTTIPMTDAQKSELVECLIRDMKNIDYSYYYVPKQPFIGIVQANLENSDNKQSNSNKVYITLDFTSTINFLKNNNLYQYFTINPEDIDSFSMSNKLTAIYGAFTVMNSTKVTSDYDRYMTKYQTKIQADAALTDEILKHSYQSYIMQKGGRYIYVRLKNVPYITQLYMPPAQMPKALQ